MSAARIREVMGVRHSAFENRGSISICGAYEGRGIGKWTGRIKALEMRESCVWERITLLQCLSPIYDTVGR